MTTIKKHKVQVVLDWASINKDVQDKAYRMARLAKLSIENPIAADKLESEITLNDEDMSLLRRAMTQGLAEIVTMCGEYIWNKSHVSDNYIIDSSNVTLTLMMPLNFNLAGCNSLGQMFHAYIVAKAMTEWYRYTNPTRVQEQQVLCEAARQEIMKIINARVRMLGGVKSVDVIVGETEKPKVTMLYVTDNENIEEMPTDEAVIKKTTERSVQFDATEENPMDIVVALPIGYKPNIGGEDVGQIGKQIYNDMVYVWWQAVSGRFYNTFSVTF